MKQTAMQELKSDLILTKSRTKDSFSEIKNQEIKDACINVVEMTLNSIIKRIDTELLEMEKEKTIDFARHCLDKAKDLDILTAFMNVEQYYSQTFKSE